VDSCGRNRRGALRRARHPKRGGELHCGTRGKRLASGVKYRQHNAAAINPGLTSCGGCGGVVPVEAVRSPFVQTRRIF
jgi:hypothetical protein